jgi:hypothetical protein
MESMRVFIAGALALSIVATAVAAPTPVGKWNGKVSIPTPPESANATPEQKAMINKMLDGVRKMVIKLEIKANNTYTLTAPSSPMDPSKVSTNPGKWTLKGNVVTLKDEKNTTSPAQEFVLSKDGKTMTADIKQGNVKVTFTRA